MLREVKVDDMEFLYQLANDFDVRKNSLNQTKIEFQKHKQWFFNKLIEIKELKSKIFIYELDKKKSGQIRLDKKGIFFIIDISIIKNYRGKGLSKIMLLDLLKKVKNISILAYIKNSNIASQCLFSSTGFKKVKACRDISFYKVRT